MSKSVKKRRKASFEATNIEISKKRLMIERDIIWMVGWAPEMMGIMVVKIAFWLVKSYDFTSQNMHYGLNRLKKSKMDKIGLKSGEIAKIRWNWTKSWFQGRCYDFDKIRCWNKIPSSCPAVFTFSQPIWSLDFNFLAFFLCMSSKL